MIGALREFVYHLEPKECYIYLDGQQYCTFVTFTSLKYNCGIGGEYPFVHCVHASSSKQYMCYCWWHFPVQWWGRR